MLVRAEYKENEPCSHIYSQWQDNHPLKNGWLQPTIHFWLDGCEKLIIKLIFNAAAVIHDLNPGNLHLKLTNN